MKEHVIHVNRDQCIGCKMCQKDCPVDNIKIEDKKAQIKEQDCIFCGHCVAICPKAAITITGFEPSIEIEEETRLDSKQLLNAIGTRRSIRHFKEEEVASEVIENIIEAGRLTPTAKNAQDVSYIVLKGKRKKYEKIAVSFFRKVLPITKWFGMVKKDTKIGDDFFFKKAPIAIVVLAKNKINGSLAAANMELMAESYGLGVLYSGFFSMAVNYSRILKKEFNLKKKKAITTLVIGYPNVKYYRTAPKEKADIKYL